MIKLLLQIFIYAIPLYPVAQSGIVINEVMLSNSSDLVDEDGDYPDWIELYNNGSNAVDLVNYGISDNVNDPFKWIFPPTAIAPGGYLIIFASSKDRHTAPYLHTNFKLSSHGEDIILTAPNTIVEDQLQPVSVSTDISYGRTEDGSSSFERLHSSTPAASNNISNNIIFSHNSGFYANTINLSMTSSNGDLIYYTTDGTDPTVSSQLYTTPLIMGSLMSVPDVISNLSTSPYWVAPTSDNFKANIIKAASFSGGVMNSNIYHKTIFVDSDTNSRYSDFNVLSIITPPSNLFDHDTGIYVMGVNYLSSNVVWSGNYFQKGELWERLGNIEYFDKQGDLLFEQNVGLRTHGGKGRNLPQKSLRLYSRSEYGAPRINYPILDHKTERVFSRLIIRNILSCWNKSVIKDECTAYISRDLNFETLDSHPVVVFINGEYWGVHSIREYFDDNFIEQAYGIEEDSINIVLHGSGNCPGQPLTWGTVEGSNDGHIQLYDFLNNNNLSIQSNYDYITEVLDIESVVDYYCTEIYFNNKDWPTNNNKLWNFGVEGKWKQVLYDLDGGWQYLGNGFNALDRTLSASGSAQNSPYATLLFRKLTESNEFVDDFVERMACLMKNEFYADTVVNAINEFKSKYQNGMQEHVDRWHYNPSSVSSWLNGVNGLISFANSRKSYVINHISTAFGINFDPDNYECDELIVEEIIDDNIAIGIKSLDEGQLVIYPNPSVNNKVWVDYTINADHVQYEVYDLMGRFLQKGNVRQHQQIALNYESGTYLVKVIHNNRYVVKKIILE